MREAYSVYIGIGPCSSDPDDPWIYVHQGDRYIRLVPNQIETLVAQLRKAAKIRREAGGARDFKEKVVIP